MYPFRDQQKEAEGRNTLRGLWRKVCCGILRQSILLQLLFNLFGNDQELGVSSEVAEFGMTPN